MPSTPGSPIVFRHRVTFRIFRAASTRSLLLMIFAAAAAISGIIAHWTFFSSTSPVASSRIYSRNPPTVILLICPKASLSTVSKISWLTSSSAGSIRGRSTISARVKSASLRLAATRSRSDCAARPANWSPDFSSLALANSSRRSVKTNRSGIEPWNRETGFDGSALGRSYHQSRVKERRAAESGGIVWHLAPPDSGAYQGGRGNSNDGGRAGPIERARLLTTFGGSPGGATESALELPGRATACYDDS